MSIEGTGENIPHSHIVAELQQMIDIDQDMRLNATDDEWDETIDQENTARMKEIVAEIGWPSISKVGETGAFNAWLLVQHADHDVAFQEHCLNLMKEVNPNDIDPKNIAYLTDRIRVNQGEGQLYGTQFTQEDNQHIPRPIEDEAEVNARRAAMGMGPLSEQIELMYEKYPFEDEKKQDE